MAVLYKMNRYLKQTLAIFLFIGFFLSIILYRWKDASHVVFDSNPVQEELSLTIEEELDQRLAYLHQTCAKYRSLMDTDFYKKIRPLYLSAPTYKWTVCKAGKTGSTFWSQFFYILNRNGRDVYKVCELTREDLHNRFASVSTKNTKSLSTRLVLTVRNPYTRLFSAYIDRIFTVSTTPLVLVKNKKKCKSQITFQEFLQNVIDSYDKGESEYHWIPLFHYCKPCENDPTFILKIETLTSDFPFIMNQTQLEPYKTEVLYKAMAENTDFSINPLVDDVLDLIAPKDKYHAKDCQSMKQITIRLWEALKIQGYIAEKVPFPVDLYKNDADYENSNIFRDVLVETRKLYPMTKSAVKDQRQHALNRFYGQVDRSTIEGIKKIYNADFELFGYSNDPPPW